MHLCVEVRHIFPKIFSLRRYRADLCDNLSEGISLWAMSSTLWEIDGVCGFHEIMNSFLSTSLCHKILYT